MHTMNSYSALRKKEAPTYGTAWMSLENIMLMKLAKDKRIKSL